MSVDVPGAYGAPLTGATWDIAHARRIGNGPPRADGGMEGREQADPGVVGVPALADFLQGILGRVADVVGKIPATALFQFGGHEEGRRMALQHHGEDLQGTLREVGQMFGHSAAVLEEQEDLVRIEVKGCWMLRSGVLEPVLSGLIEGIVSAKRGRRYRARLARMGSGDDVTAIVDLTPRAE